MEAYRIEQLSFAYPDQSNLVLDHLDLSVLRGEFVTICGQSGSGKSTLLRHLKSVLTPHGERTGSIWFEGQRLEELEQRKQASAIGYVLQNPDNQIVTDKVWHELAFGLESLGYDQPTIRLRVAEMASFFGIQTWFHKQVIQLSGGQKQMLNLASVMVMQPSVLVLDEPTSMLDPIAAQDFLETLKRINRELGTTIIITEHRLEEVVTLTDRLIVMDHGKMMANGAPAVVGEQLHRDNHPMFLAMPAAMQIVKGIKPQETCLVTVNEARQWLSRLGEHLFVDISKTKSADQTDKKTPPPLLQFKEVWFRYDRTSADVIKDLSLNVTRGEFYGLVGGNGTGKTTALSLMGGLLRPYRGKVLLNGKEIHTMSQQERAATRLAILPQNPQNLFVKKTVELDLREMLQGLSLSSEAKEERLEEIIRVTALTTLLQQHPYDLSGGEQQRAALAKVLLLDPALLLLDEPTKGLDAFFKDQLADMLGQLTNKGVTIVMVSHDVEFCAKYVDRCSLFFDGGIVTTKPTRDFFAGNRFYTTSANRIARHLCAEAITVEDVIQTWTNG